MTHACITELLENRHFIGKIDQFLRLRVAGLELYDIPELLLVIVEFTCRHQVGINRVPMNQLEAVWNELITTILEHFSAIPAEEEDTYLFIARGCVKLLLVHPDTIPSRARTMWENGFNWNIWTRIRTWGCFRKA